jgi:hypothetical protein
MKMEPRKMEIGDKFVEQMMSTGIIVKAQPSAWSLHCLLVPKDKSTSSTDRMIQRANASGPEPSMDPKDWRWVFNGIKLNDITPNKFSLQLPTSAEVSDLVNGKVVASVDLRESFHTIPLTKKTQLKCSFYWRNSKYLYARLAMGLKNACTYLSEPRTRG